MEDERYEEKVTETQSLCRLINNVMQQLAIIPLFEKDPFTMNFEEFNPFYKKIKEEFFTAFIMANKEKEHTSTNLNEVIEEEGEASVEHVEEDERGEENEEAHSSEIEAEVTEMQGKEVNGNKELNCLD